MAGVLLVACLWGAPAAADDTAPRVPQHSAWYTASEWSLVGCHALDTAYSQRLIGTGRFHEATPVLGRFDSPAYFVGVKFGLAFTQLKATRSIGRHGHPRLAAATNAIIAGVMCGVSAHNARLYREDRQ